MAAWRIGWKTLALLALSLVLVPLQVLVRLVTRGPAAAWLPMRWHAGVRRILGIRVEVVGTVGDGHATLFVGNHVSHFDIFVLGGVLPGSFIAKDEMARWPLANKLCALQDTVFVSRNPRDAGRVAAAMHSVLQRRRSLILFPEGTTSDGSAVAPFKSSLFSVFLGPAAGAWTVQPFTLSLQAVDGHELRLGGDRDGYAFHGDMAMGAHLLKFLGLRGARLRLVLHAPRVLAPDEDRKRLAAELHAVVASGL